MWYLVEPLIGAVMFALYLKVLSEALGVRGIVLPLPLPQELAERVEEHTIGKLFEVVVSLDRQTCKKLSGSRVQLERSGSDPRLLFIAFRDPLTGKLLYEHGFSLPPGYTFMGVESFEVEDCTVYAALRIQKELR